MCYTERAPTTFPYIFGSSDNLLEKGGVLEQKGNVAHSLSSVPAPKSF